MSGYEPNVWMEIAMLKEKVDALERWRDRAIGAAFVLSVGIGALSVQVIV